MDKKYRLILILSSLLLLFSCGEPYALVEILDGDATRSEENNLSLLPESATMAYGESISFVAIGGTPPYSFSLVNTGSTDPSLDSSSGDYTSGSTTGIDIIRVTDSLGLIRDSPITITSLAANVNYGSITVNNAGSTQGGDALAGSFTFANNGTYNGTETLSWSVFLSLDATLGAGDMLADSGTTSFLNASDTSAAVPFSGTWPVPGSDREYYLILTLSAADETDYSDNQGSAAVTVTAPPPADIDYFVQSMTYTASPFEAGSPISQSFIFGNSGTDPGYYDPYWSVYYSNDDELDETDVLADKGSFTNLFLDVGGIRNINIDGNWPSSAGVYYLIVSVTSADDGNSFNDTLARGPFTVNTTADVVDYAVSGLTADYPNISSGDFCSETFDITNLGGKNGALENSISWTAYASLDETLDDTPVTGDPVINSSSGSDLSALISGSGYVDIPIGGTWPAAPGSYTLFVRIEAGDDPVTENNTISTGPFILSEPPDYTVSSVTALLSTGSPGAALGEIGDFSFVISETAGATGHQRIGWEVYASYDAVLDGDDTRLAYGDMAPLALNASAPAIPFHDSSWPVMGSYYYLIIIVTAGDDINGINDIWVSPDHFVVPFVYTEGVEDNSYDDNLVTDSSLVSSLGPTLTGGDLSPYELILIQGVTDDKNYYDTYSFTLDGGVNILDVNAAWSIGGNEIDMFLWDDAGGSWSSEDLSSDTEPSAPPLVINGLTGGAEYYAGLFFTPFITNGIEASYDVYIYARP